MNKTGITKITGSKPTQILFATQMQQAVSVLVSNADVTAGSDGSKIVKAGTPLAGNLEARGTAFTVAEDTGSGDTATSDAVAILLHDADVTNGSANAAALIFGFVNLDRIDTTTQALITAAAKKALPMIKFLKD